MFQDVLLENRWFKLNKTGANAENDIGALIGFGVDQILPWSMGFDLEKLD